MLQGCYDCLQCPKFYCKLEKIITFLDFYFGSKIYDTIYNIYIINLLENKQKQTNKGKILINPILTYLLYRV